MTMPETEKRSFPLNAWYIAAWDAEVGRTTFARTVCGKRMLLYRRMDDRPVALEDVCWHRLAPLLLGRLEGDNIICPYHGLKFNDAGRCVHMPSQETINPAACVRAFPLVERHRFLWVWPGNPTSADPALIPDLHWNQSPQWTADGSMLPLACNFRLVLDNLMD